MKYLTILECPVAYPAENAHSLSSKDLMPRFGVTAGLESQHLRVLENRITSVCIWQSEALAKRYFDADWSAKADDIWGDEYRIRSEPIDSASAA
ncbi:hypothetical protein [Methylobacterium aerolatum]|uniref:ABM domain-containing protein n=1 Tax=Methylobacterium aerolatum TaxID=418708 RepID=A0ABU0I5K6_9HYPH|nr:hypothetical protein [Methylobacterium aerolatum]MDQ0449896.1 hypothetical protein [Methylobacterium aerolatum]GJD37427.1 hypothetical protein FMGBMHLM_4358 [Methylobacterium aerolatum]